uniref:Uncharacterized protein n=1 Tax=Anguilla anguilla TaxID=7936 RepID=A0A0E9R9S0_ANGAN
MAEYRTQVHFSGLKVHASCLLWLH